MLGSQLVTLLGDVIEPLEGGTLMEKRVFELPVCGWNVIHCSMLGRLASHSCIHAFLPQWTVSPQTANPDKPSLPKVAFLGIFRHSNSKVTSTRVFISLWTQEWNFRVIKKKNPAFWRTARPISPQLHCPTPHSHPRGCRFVITHGVSFHGHPGNVKWHLTVVLWLPEFELLQFKSYYALLIFCFGFLDLHLKVR